jgi:hypothetical protein
MPTKTVQIPANNDLIARRVLELVHTVYDLSPVAEDLGYHGEPFRCDEIYHA